MADKIAVADLYNMSDEQIAALDESQIESSEEIDQETNQEIADADIADVDFQQQTSEDSETEEQEESEEGDSGNSSDSSAENDEYNDEIFNTGTDSRDSEDIAGEQLQHDSNSDGSRDTVDESSEEEATGDEANQSSKQSDRNNGSGLTSEQVEQLANYEKIMQPFKAAHTQIQVKSPEEVIALMQQGVDYHTKMQAIKPHLTKVRLLDKYKIDDQSLNYLIDIHNKNPEAIQKLIKDSGIDPLDINLEDNSNYQAKNYSADPSLAQEVELDSVLQSIEKTPTYQRTIDVLGNQWDEASKQQVAKEPSVIKIINDQIANGVYDRVTSEVTRLRALGNLVGLSDIDAYSQVGHALQNAGAFNDLNLGNAQGNDNNVHANNKVDASTNENASSPSSKQNQDDLNARRRAASPTRQKAASKKPKITPESILSMSDEEFEKQFGKLG